jgi:phage-related protein
MSSVPVEHIDDLQSLTPDYECDLFEIVLLDEAGTILIWNGLTSTWQGQTYEFIPCKIDQENLSTDGSRNRPNFSFYNPDGVFTPYILSGVLEGAIVTRRRVLAGHLRDDLNISQDRVWQLVRVVSISPGAVIVEFRDLSAGPHHVVPFRQFLPPEFPTVSI